MKSMTELLYVAVELLYVAVVVSFDCVLPAAWYFAAGKLCHAKCFRCLHLTVIESVKTDREEVRMAFLKI